VTKTSCTTTLAAENEPAENSFRKLAMRLNAKEKIKTKPFPLIQTQRFFKGLL
jgi:hypothetical protein